MANKTIGGLTQVDSITSATKYEVEKDGGSYFGDFSQMLTFLNTYYGGAPTSYTPTFGSDMGTVSSISAYYIRQGSLMWIYGSATLGTAGGGTDVWISLPSGLNLKSTKIVSRKTKLGECTRLLSSRTSISSTLNPHLCYDSGLSSATNRLRFASYTQSGLYDQDAASGLFNNNEVISIATGPLPIDEWGA